MLAQTDIQQFLSGENIASPDELPLDLHFVPSLMDIRAREPGCTMFFPEFLRVLPVPERGAHVNPDTGKIRLPGTRRETCTARCALCNGHGAPRSRSVRDVPGWRRRSA